MSPVPNPLLPAGAVATVDRLLGRLRTDVCQIKRKGTTRDVGGSPVEAYGVVAVADCQVRAVNRAANTLVVGGQLTALADYEVVFFRAVQVREGDRITVNGETFRAVNVPNEASHAFVLTVAVSLAD